MTRYEAGRRFEWRVRDELTDDGYAVIRSAGSKTKVDLVAIKPGQWLLVQCKRDGRIGPAERSKLLSLASMCAALPVVAALDGGRPAQVTYRLLTGAGPRDWETRSADVVEVAT